MSGIVASAVHADYVIAAMVAFWLGFVWLPVAAAGATYIARRLGALAPAVSFSGSAAIANYVANRALLGDELRAHSWAYALATLLAALTLVGGILALESRLRRPTSGCS